MRVQIRCFIAAAGAALAVIAAAPGAAAAGDGGICAGCPTGGDGEVGEALSLAQLRDLTREIGFAKPRVAAAIAMAESSGDPGAINRNQKPRRSIDRGLFQINSRWHFEVSKSCALDARCNAREALRISDGGRHWHQWATWHNQAYEAWL